MRNNETPRLLESYKTLAKFNDIIYTSESLDCTKTNIRQKLINPDHSFQVQKTKLLFLAQLKKSQIYTQMNPRGQIVTKSAIHFPDNKSQSDNSK